MESKAQDFDRIPAGRGAYAAYVAATVAHTTSLFPRRRINFMVLAVIFSPLIIPIALAIPDLWYDPDGRAVFERLADLLYLGTIVPLVALFYAGALISEDIERQTIPYILSRPIPRSAWVLGKFLAYLLVTVSLLALSFIGTHVACSFLSNYAITWESTVFMLKYLACISMAILGYGALGLAFGARFKRPMIAGLVFVYVWQRVARLLPGSTSNFTISYYVDALRPVSVDKPFIQEIVVGVLGDDALGGTIGPVNALLVIVVFTALSIALTTWTVTHREFSASKAMGS